MTTLSDPMSCAILHHGGCHYPPQHTTDTPQGDGGYPHGHRRTPAWDPVWTPAVVVDLAHHGAWRQWAARLDGDA